jgi:hypothetical protein
MNPVGRNVLAVVIGLVIGGVVNMGLVSISSTIVPPPPGADMSTIEGIKAAISEMSPRHFLMPFLAHAVGTFVGALVAAAIATNYKMLWALLIGICFLLGGLTAIVMIGGPTWFIVGDLALAYLPTAWLGGKLGSTMSNRKAMAAKR